MQEAHTLEGINETSPQLPKNLFVEASCEKRMLLKPLQTTIAAVASVEQGILRDGHLSAAVVLDMRGIMREALA